MKAAVIGVGALLGWLFGGAINWILGGFFKGFNKTFDITIKGYGAIVGLLLRLSVIVLLIYGGLMGLTYLAIVRVPKGFIPEQDKGYLVVNVQLPDSASLQRTDRVMRQIEEVVRATPGVSHTVSIGGQSVLLNANAPNFGSMFVMLDEFHHRLEPHLSASAIADRLQSVLQDSADEGLVQVFGAPPVEGLGTAGGFKIVVEDRGDLGPDVLQDVADEIVVGGNESPGLDGLYTSFRARTSWLSLKIDRTAAKRLGVPLSEVFNTLQAEVGSLYVNDFNRFGRTWQVNVQASEKYRNQVEDLKRVEPEIRDELALESRIDGPPAGGLDRFDHLGCDPIRRQRHHPPSI